MTSPGRQRGRGIGVVGASARAAVHSLARAGFDAWAVDLFADRDLARVAPCEACPLGDYPAALPRLADRFPPGPVLYTGGLENHPQVVAELAARRELWGNPPNVLGAVRDPLFVSRTLGRGGLSLTFPHSVPATAPPPEVPGARWLLKPRAGAGGRGIRVWERGDPLPTNARRWYLQELIDGVPMSAAFVTDGSKTVLFGVTEQMVGTPWLNAPDFGYAGNSSPVEAPPTLEDILQRTGEVLATAGGLRGVWGLDFVLGTDSAPYPIEVNPRYTAGVEVLEHASGCAVWSARPASGAFRPARGASGPHCGKAIYYAPHALTFPSSGPWDDDLAGTFDPWRLPVFADIPEPGSPFEPGEPVITVLVSGSSPRECRARLQSRAAELDQLFAEAPR